MPRIHVLRLKYEFSSLLYLSFVKIPLGSSVLLGTKLNRMIEVLAQVQSASEMRRIRVRKRERGEERLHVYALVEDSSRGSWDPFDPRGCRGQSPKRLSLLSFAVPGSLLSAALRITLFRSGLGRNETKRDETRRQTGFSSKDRSEKSEGTGSTDPRQPARYRSRHRTMVFHPCLLKTRPSRLGIDIQPTFTGTPGEGIDGKCD